MQASECIKTRRSVRDFRDDPISDGILEEIIEVASHAPSWKNRQVCRYNVIRDRETLNKIADCGTFGSDWNKSIIYGAPALVVVTYYKGICGYEKDGSHSTPKGGEWQMFDAGIVSQTFCLAAWDKGIGSVIMGIFDEEVVGKIINISYQEQVAALIAIGYPYTIPEEPKKKEVKHLLRLL